MYVKLQDGREIEISVYGKYVDDLQFDCDEELDDDAVEHIQTNYADEMYEEWMEQRITQADYYLCDLGGD